MRRALKAGANVQWSIANLQDFFEKILHKKLASGFGSKKQADFGQASRFFEFDAAHRTKKTAMAGQNLTFFGRNASG